MCKVVWGLGHGNMGFWGWEQVAKGVGGAQHVVWHPQGHGVAPKSMVLHVKGHLVPKGGLVCHV